MLDWFAHYSNNAIVFYISKVSLRKKRTSILMEPRPSDKKHTQKYLKICFSLQQATFKNIV